MSTLSKEIIYLAIDELNDAVEDGPLIEKAPLTTLLGYESIVDSLSLVRLLTAVERLVEEKTGKTIVIVDESAFEAEQSPFATVGTLINHVGRLISM
jgi:hypothetical protein